MGLVPPTGAHGLPVNPLDGHIFHLKLTGNGATIPGRLVVPNTDKWDFTESAPLLFGRGFGVVTDLRTAPSGNLVVVSLTHGTVYEIVRREGTGGGTGRQSGAKSRP